MSQTLEFEEEVLTTFYMTSSSFLKSKYSHILQSSLEASLPSSLIILTSSAEYGSSLFELFLKYITLS